MPLGFVMGWLPAASAAAGSTMGEARAMARFFTNGAEAARIVILTVVGSMASTFSTPLPASFSPNTKDA